LRHLLPPLNQLKQWIIPQGLAMEKTNNGLESVSGLSLGLNTNEVIVIGNITLLYYVTDKGQKRVKIIAPNEVNISRVNREEYLKYKR
jgi:sRNA-binding carbon storage regulator CsrA